MATQAAKLWLPVGTNNSYRQALSIPLDDFQHFSLAGLAWLHYVAFTIYGREEQRLMRTKIWKNPRDTTMYRKVCRISLFKDASHLQYYHQSRLCCWIQIWWMAGLQWQVLSPPTGTISGRRWLTAMKPVYWQVLKKIILRVISFLMQRLTRCVLRISLELFRYMVSLANHRGEDVDPPLDNINDTRNGILLYSAFHRAFGESRVAFLRVSCRGSIFFTWLTRFIDPKFCNSGDRCGPCCTTRCGPPTLGNETRHIPAF